MGSESAPITMKDIARELGVSVATVSRALKDSPRISREKREQIKAYAAEHMFSPNALAENLRNSRVKPTNIIGVIVPEYTHYFFSSVLSGIDEVATERGYCLMTAQSAEKYENEVKICQRFFDNKVCGIVVSQAKDTVQYGHFQHLIDSGMPLVFYDRICTGVNASRVVVDDYQGAYNAVDHLIKTGCRHIAYYGSPRNLEISKNRFNGWKDAQLKNGITPSEEFVFNCDSRKEAEDLTREILQREQVPDAFFAVNDDTAFGIIVAAKRLGYRIPQDISVCGFTNHAEATICDPTLTTVEQRGVEIGRQAAEILIAKVEGRMAKDTIEKRVVRTRLVERESTR